jgi:hypothetical protein
LGLHTALKELLGPLNILPALDASFASVVPGAIIIVAPGHGRRSSAEDEGRRESNLGLGQHFISPVRLIDFGRLPRSRSAKGTIYSKVSAFGGASAKAGLVPEAVLSPAVDASGCAKQELLWLSARSSRIRASNSLGVG